VSALESQSILKSLGAKRRCGIYLLIFSSGEIYIGQSVRVQKRFQEHLQKYGEIAGFSFMDIEASNLDHIEESLIKHSESEGFFVRNFIHASRPSLPSPFDEVVHPDLQTHFLSGVEPEKLYHEQRRHEPEIRRKAEFSFQKLRKHSHFKALSSLIQAYGKVAIPSPAETEVGYWCVTALPSTRDKVLFRFNIYRQEVMNCGEDEQGFFVRFFLAKTVIERDWGKTFKKLPFPNGFLEFDDFTYKPGGFDQSNIIVNGLNNAMEFLSNRTAVESIRKFNISLMRKGPNAWAQNHCPQLADEIFKSAQ
jgi:hypothetical protein